MPKNYLKPVNVGGIVLPNNVWLAPLAGYSHVSLRTVAKKFGAGYAVTEMVSVEGIARGHKKTMSYAVLDDEWTGVQLFGSNPQRFYDAAAAVKRDYGARIVDVNFGCPVRKVMRAGAGSALLADPVLMGEIVAAVKSAGLVVTAKIRSGIETVNIRETIPAVVNAGADAVIYHARTAKQMYAGKADWPLIREARDLTDGVLIANGDVNTPEDAERMFEETLADGIMIGRAAVGKPYLFAQIRDYFETGTYRQPTIDEVKSCMKDFARLFLEVSPKKNLKDIRGALVQYIKGYRDSKGYRSRIANILTYDELLEVLDDWEGQE